MLAGGVPRVLGITRTLYEDSDELPDVVQLPRGALGLIVSAFAPPVRRRGGRCRTALEAVAHVATTMRPRDAARAWLRSPDAARILEWLRTEHRGAVVPLTFGTTPARFSGSEASHRFGQRDACVVVPPLDPPNAKNLVPPA